MKESSVAALPESVRKAYIEKGVWNSDCPVSLERLAAVTVSYVDFKGASKTGEIVVMDVFARAVHSIFEQLRQREFPIGRVTSIHEYGGDDDRSMQDNNTSCFNHRSIAGSGKVSMHSYGLAIDINPLQNPIVIIDEDSSSARVAPDGSWQFLNRGNRKPGMVEDVRDIFEACGFSVWGGAWTTPIDYHHFQTPRGVAELLAVVSQEDGSRLVELIIENPETVAGIPSGAALEEVLGLLADDKERFFSSFPDLFK